MNHKMKLKSKENLLHLLDLEEGWMESQQRMFLQAFLHRCKTKSLKLQLVRSQYHLQLPRPAFPAQLRGSLFLVQMQTVLQKKSIRCYTSFFYY